MLKWCLKYSCIFFFSNELLSSSKRIILLVIVSFVGVIFFFIKEDVVRYFVYKLWNGKDVFCKSWEILVKLIFYKIFCCNWNLKDFCYKVRIKK